MPDPNTDANTTASSAVPVDPSTALASASPEALNAWRMTGELPTSEPTEEPTSKAAEIDAAQPVEQAASTDASVKVASEPTTTPKGVALKARNAALDAEIADLEAKLRRRHELRQQVDAPATPQIDAKPAVSSAAPATDPEPNPDDATKYPDGQYDRKFLKDQAAWEAREVLRAERAVETERRQIAARDADEQRVNDAWAVKVEAARLKHADFEEKAFGPTEIRKGSPIDLWILDSPDGAEVLYALQTTPGEVRRLSALPPMQQLRELAALETRLSTPQPVKTLTDAPDPPRTLGSRTTSAGDPVASAVNTKDVSAYIAEMNKRESASRRL